jgi:hypothetical protein
VIVGIQCDRALERRERFAVQAAVIEHLAHRDVQERALGSSETARSR